MTWNPYSIPEFFVGTLLFFLGLIVFSRNIKAYVNRIFALFCLVCCVWLLGFGFLYLCDNLSSAELWVKIVYTGVTFTSALFYHFTRAFFKIRRDKLFLIFVYAASFAFLYLTWAGKLLDVPYKYYWGYFPKFGKYHPLFMLYLTVVNLYTLYLQYHFYKEAKVKGGVEFSRVQYVFVAFLIGNGVLVNFFPTYGIQTYPIAQTFMAVLFIVISFTIIKHRLMNISIALTRTSIFLFVYSLVLGIPFAMGFGWKRGLISLLGELWWVAPLVLSTILATGGPFFYMYLRKNTEDRLYKSQRQYQNTLRKASLGMGRIKDLNRLLNLIVHVVTRTVRIEHCSIYVYHESSGHYVLKAKKGKMIDVKTESVFSGDTQIVKYLDKIKEPILYDELKRKSAESVEKTYGYLANTMKNLDAALILPSFVEQRLIAFLVLGAKKSKEVYNHEDLVVFSILANQSGLAIENAQFYEDMKKTHEQLFKAEKMATIGTMADGLSHQMNNRLHAMGFIAGDAIDSVRMKRDKNKPEDDKKFLDDLEHSLIRIEDNVKRGGEIAEGLLRYTRKGEEGFSPVSMNKLLDAVLEMIQFKINMRNLDFVREIKDTLPAIKGNFTQLQEAFFNIVDNAYDAMMQKRDELKEKGYSPKLIISACKKGKNIEILIKDNGMGVKEEDMRKLFTPFFTTKLSSKKGTGLGLYVIRQIIEENHNGKVKFTSTYKEGSETCITLPVAEAQMDAKKEASLLIFKNAKTFYKE